MVKPSHKWLPTISGARIVRQSRPIHYDQVRVLIAEVKALIKKESNTEVRSALSKAGIELSKILLK